MILPPNAKIGRNLQQHDGGSLSCPIVAERRRRGRALWGWYRAPRQRVLRIPEMANTRYALQRCEPGSGLRCATRFLCRIGVELAAQRSPGLASLNLDMAPPAAARVDQLTNKLGRSWVQDTRAAEDGAARSRAVPFSVTCWRTLVTIRGSRMAQGGGRVLVRYTTLTLQRSFGPHRQMERHHPFTAVTENLCAKCLAKTSGSRLNRGRKPQLYTHALNPRREMHKAR